MELCSQAPNLRNRKRIPLASVFQRAYLIYLGRDWVVLKMCRGIPYLLSESTTDNVFQPPLRSLLLCSVYGAGYVNLIPLPRSIAVQIENQ